jgi:hypothetical protein
MVMDLEMEGWLMRILSERTQRQKPHPPSPGIDFNQEQHLSSSDPSTILPVPSSISTHEDAGPA